MAATFEIKALLLDAYHRKLALSQIPNGYAPYFQLDKIQWGWGLIDTSTGSELIEEIPSDLYSLQEVFATGDATYVYIEGVIRITARLPTEQLLDQQIYRWSNIGILDSDGGLVCVAALNTQQLTNKMDATVVLEIDTLNGNCSITI